MIGYGGTGTPSQGNIGGSGLVPNQYAAPFVDQMNLGSSLASYGAANAPQASAFQSNLLGSNPWSATDQAYMNNQGAVNARALQQSQAKTDAQFGSNPMSSGYLRSAADAQTGMTQNLNQAGLGLAENTQNLGAQTASGLLGNPMQQAQGSTAAAAGLTNLTSGLYENPFTTALSIAQQAPYSSPTIISNPGSSGGK